MHILIAPNSFRGSLNALDVAKAIERGLLKANPSFSTHVLPIADGGDFFTEVMAFALNGTLQTCASENPLGKTITTVWCKVDENTAFIEVAKASGTHLLSAEQLNPYKTSSFGTGVLIKEAIQKGCTRIVVGLGGSATVDGGIGILQALGFSFLNKKGNAIEKSGKHLEEIVALDESKVAKKVRHCSFELLCDVDNPLLGEKGAAKIFGPQKGATEKQVAQLESNLTHLANKVEEWKGISIHTIKHGGAAGGIAAFLHALLGAKLLPGTSTILDLVDFSSHLKKADLVITGEGKIDTQTLDGKGPHGVALAAKTQYKPVIGIAGATPTESNHAFKDFDALFSICSQPMPLEEAIQNAPQLIENISFNIGKSISLTT